MLQKFLAATVAEEWAREHDLTAGEKAPLLIETSTLAAEISTKTLSWLQADPPAAYHEMAFTLARIQGECYNLLQSFAQDCKIPYSSIPILSTEVDVTGTKQGCFTIQTAQDAVGDMFTKLKDSLGRTKKRELTIIKDKRTKVTTSIEHYIEVKAQYDVRVSAAFAAAFVALKSTPDKVSPIVKGIMNSIKVRCFILIVTSRALTWNISRTRIMRICRRDRPLLWRPLSNFVCNEICLSHLTRSSRTCAHSYVRIPSKHPLSRMLVRSRRVFSRLLRRRASARRAGRRGQPAQRILPKPVCRVEALNSPSKNYQRSLVQDFWTLSRRCGSRWQAGF